MRDVSFWTWHWPRRDLRRPCVGPSYRFPTSSVLGPRIRLAFKRLRRSAEGQRPRRPRGLVRSERLRRSAEGQRPRRPHGPVRSERLRRSAEASVHGPAVWFASERLRRSAEASVRGPAVRFASERLRRSAESGRSGRQRLAERNRDDWIWLFADRDLTWWRRSGA
jgi:hypothetical protein